MYRTQRANGYDFAYGSLTGSSGGIGTAANPYTLFQGVRLTNMTSGGLITYGNLKGQQFASNGALSTFNTGALTGAASTAIGGDGAYDNGSIKSSLRNDQVFGRFDFQINDTTNFHAEGLADLKGNVGYGNYGQITSVTLSTANAYLTPAQQAAMTPANTFTMGKLFTQGARNSVQTQQNQMYFNAGLDGKFAENRFN